MKKIGAAVKSWLHKCFLLVPIILTVCTILVLSEFCLPPTRSWQLLRLTTGMGQAPSLAYLSITAKSGVLISKTAAGDS